MIRVYPISLQRGAASTGSFILQLLEPTSCRQVPIIIGVGEAHAIVMALEEAHARRPLTHELMLNVMSTYGLTLLQVSVDRVSEGIFYASLHVSDGFNTRLIDSRTTDAVVLALQAHVPIMMAESVLDETGVRVEPSPDEPSSNPSSLEELQQELQRCEENEDYERAAELQQQIDKLTSQ